MAQFGVIYLLTNPQHAARLVVSLRSLREYYDGPVTLFVTRQQSADVVEHLVAEDRLRLEARYIQEADVEHNSTYVTKPRLLTETPYDATLFLDADTLVTGPIDELLDAVRHRQLVVTGFCDWHTQMPVMTKRFEDWLPLAGTDGDVFNLSSLIQLAMAHPLPVINVGVFGFHRTAPSLKAWRQLTDFGHDRILPDEMSLQILLPEIEHFLLSTKYNCSPAFYANQADIRIWHFVGTSHMIHDNSRIIWQAAYERCREDNVAQIVEWSRFEQKRGPLPEAYRRFIEGSEP